MAKSSRCHRPLSWWVYGLISFNSYEYNRKFYIFYIMINHMPMSIQSALVSAQFVRFPEVKIINVTCSSSHFTNTLAISHLLYTVSVLLFLSSVCFHRIHRFGLLKAELHHKQQQHKLRFFQFFGGKKHNNATTFKKKHNFYLLFNGRFVNTLIIH